MTLPIRTVIRPAILTGLTNGRLPDSALRDTPGLAGGPTIRLVLAATRAWRALTAAASAAGHTLKATSAADSYRPYAIQEAVFRQRYTTNALTGRPYRVWDGVRWYQKPGTAPAAVPGTSNHGLGLAVDVGEERDGDTGTETMDEATLAWLVAHELTYGFSHELVSEPWHIRYTTGDAIPAAVLAYEQGDDDMPLTQADADLIARTLLTYDPGTPDGKDLGGVRTPPYRSDAATNTTVQTRWIAEHLADELHATRADINHLADAVAALAKTVAASHGPIATTASGIITLTPNP